MTPWWTDQQAGLYGGIAGSALGILGGIIGTLTGIFAPQGRCKTLIFGLCFFTIGVGVICLVTGLIALTMGQPYGVYYPLLLIGILGTCVLGGLTPVIRMRYREAESRKLQAEDLRRG